MLKQKQENEWTNEQTKKKRTHQTDILIMEI